MKKGLSFYWKLFLSTFTISAFTIGGGYVIVPLMRKKFVEKLHWIEDQEMLDLVAIAQAAPEAKQRVRDFLEGKAGTKVKKA